MEFFKVLIIGVIVSILTVLLKQIKPEYSLICVIVGSAILIFYIISGVQSILNYFSNIASKSGIDSNIFTLLLKIIGIGYLVEFSAGICNDSGNSSIADKVILFGKLTIFALSIPIVTNLFNLVVELVQ